ncbi:hypothetical protein C900_00972 [Fulvivirga imtechensis AK7]|uniref:USP domain-containing protein n=1 Tax=Fulvivirga imtechensis AK7 TaxID=1237149 RepID=L8JWL5_9BACT|nr:DUF4157 domain-containing protein [Fulvivirga imtechensis]ELR72593.1 hypothetical protein C900_00972 [Fulvivirga imtechensis AK7]
MKRHADKKKASQSGTRRNKVPNAQTATPAFGLNGQFEATGSREMQLVNNSADVKQQSTLQAVANSTPEATQLRAVRGLVENSQQKKEMMQLQKAADENTMYEPILRKSNDTGLPDHIKSGIENLSGYAMDDVKVHYNSNKPAQLQAHAYAQGTDIHLAPGQEKHLSHEAWHVVQQKQGRVKPTGQINGKVSINDDAGLEKEADVMGSKVKSGSCKLTLQTKTEAENGPYVAPLQGVWVRNLSGEVTWDDKYKTDKDLNNARSSAKDSSDPSLAYIETFDSREATKKEELEGKPSGKIWVTENSMTVSGTSGEEGFVIMMGEGVEKENFLRLMGSSPKILNSVVKINSFIDQLVEHSRTKQEFEDKSYWKKPWFYAFRGNKAKGITDAPSWPDEILKPGVLSGIEEGINEVVEKQKLALIQNYSGREASEMMKQITLLNSECVKIGTYIMKMFEKKLAGAIGKQETESFYNRWTGTIQSGVVGLSTFLGGIFSQYFVTPVATVTTPIVATFGSLIGNSTELQEAVHSTLSNALNTTIDNSTIPVLTQAVYDAFSNITISQDQIQGGFGSKTTSEGGGTEYLPIMLFSLGGTALASSLITAYITLRRSDLSPVAAQSKLTEELKSIAQKIQQRADKQEENMLKMVNIKQKEVELGGGEKDKSGGDNDSKHSKDTASPTGISNIGNTCYISAGLNMLAFSPYYNLFKPNSEGDSSKEVLKAEVKSLLDIIKGRKGVDDKKIAILFGMLRSHKIITSELGSQEDTDEIFLNKLLPYVAKSDFESDYTLEQSPTHTVIDPENAVRDEEIKNPLGLSELNEQNQIAGTPSNESVLTLHLTDEKDDLNTIMSRFFSESEPKDISFRKKSEQEEDQDKAFKAPATKKVALGKETPEALTIKLLRFTAHKDSKKITTKIDMPDAFVLNGFVYELKVVVYNSGETPKSGHYTANTKGEDDKWTYRSDSNVGSSTDTLTDPSDTDAYLYVYAKNEAYSEEKHTNLKQLSASAFIK